ncbi:MAG: hypothetical protein P0S94_01455 [Simkaniaceae bacterium]|nr:hypothetical protein [Simkaniaceae bacterium]
MRLSIDTPATHQMIHDVVTAFTGRERTVEISDQSRRYSLCMATASTAATALVFLATFWVLGTAGALCLTGIVVVAVAVDAYLLNRSLFPVVMANIRGEIVTTPDAKKEYSDHGKEAIAFARGMLREHPETERFVWTYLDNQPVNTEIAFLTGLYYNVAQKKLWEVVKQHKEGNLLDYQDVKEAADDMMKIAFAIGCLSLDDAHSVQKAIQRNGENRSFVGTMVTQDSYLYRTFFFMPNAYQGVVRPGLEWSEEGAYQDAGVYPCHPIPDEYAKEFYKEGTMQAGWRALYNEFCARIEMYVTRVDLQNGQAGSWGDQRFTNWTEKDKSQDTFRICCDTQPT